MSDKIFESQLQRAKDAYFSHDYESAEKLLERCLKTQPTSLQVLLELGKVYVSAQKDEKALAVYNRILQIDPHCFVAMDSLGGIYRRLKRYQESIDILNAAFKEEPDSTTIYYNLGQTYKFMGKDDEAIDCFEVVLASNPDDVLAYNHLGCLYAAHGKHEKAIDQFRHALHVDPNHPIIHYNAALSYEALGRNDDAIDSYESALRKKPGWLDAIKGYSGLLHRCHKDAEAEALLRKAISLKPSAPNIHAALGNLLVQQNRIDEATECFDTALSLDKNNYAAISGKVALLETLGKREEAYDLLLKLEQIMPENTALSLQCAHLLLNMGNYAEASNRLRVVLDKEPQNPDALCLLGEYLLIKGEDAKALHCFEKGIKIKPENISYRFDTARHLYGLGNYELAEVQMRFYLSAKPDDVDAWIYLGRLYTELGEIENAVKVFRKVLSLDASNPALLAAVTSLDKVYPDNSLVKALLKDVLSEHSGGIDDLADLEKSLAAYEQALNFAANESDLERNLRLLENQQPFSDVQDEDEEEINDESATDEDEPEEFSLMDDGFDALREQSLEEEPAPMEFDISDEDVNSDEDSFESMVLGNDDAPLDVSPNEFEEVYDPDNPKSGQDDGIFESEEVFDLNDNGVLEDTKKSPPPAPQPPQYPPMPQYPQYPQYPPYPYPPQTPPDWNNAAPAEPPAPPKPPKRSEMPKPPAPPAPIDTTPAEDLIEEEPFEMTPSFEDMPKPKPLAKEEPKSEPPLPPKPEPKPEPVPPKREPEVPAEPPTPPLKSEPVAQSEPEPVEPIAEADPIAESEPVPPKPPVLPQDAVTKGEMKTAIRTALNKLRAETKAKTDANELRIANMFQYMRGLCDFLPQPKKTLFMSSGERVQLEYVINKLNGIPGLLDEARAVRETVDDTQTSPETFVRRDKEKKQAAADAVQPTPSDINNTFLYLQNLADNIPDKQLASALNHKMRGVLTRCDNEDVTL